MLWPPTSTRSSTGVVLSSYHAQGFLAICDRVYAVETTPHRPILKLLHLLAHCHLAVLLRCSLAVRISQRMAVRRRRQTQRQRRVIA